MIEGIAADRPCPECGCPAGESHPERRIGSPWQRAPGFGAWMRTFAMMLRRPAASWMTIRAESPRSLRLLLLNVSIGSMLTTAAFVHGPIWAAPMLSLLAMFTVVFMLMLALTSVEFTGIRLLAGRHGYRITPTIALTVCAHASAGWIVSGALLILSVQAVQRIGPLWNGSLGIIGGWNVGAMVALGAAIAGFVAGMIVFSVLSGVGYRAMRYANAG